MLEEAKKKGFLVKNEKGEDYLIQTVGFPAYLIDLTNPKAVAWTKSIIKKNMIDVGLSGWMADFGEWLPYDAVLHSGVSAKNYHNQYPVDWAKLNREAIKEAGKEGEIVFFTRAGFSYSNKYSTLFWLGDQMVSFQTHDGLPSAVLGMMTSGVSGISLNHSDIGGYTTISNPITNYHRSKELLLRWSEMSALSPVFRTHEGNRPLKNWQVYNFENALGEKSQSDEETVEKFANMGKLHYALKDYLKIYVREASRTGIPVVRHPYLHYPNDLQVRNLKYQYLLGEDLMVMPVISDGESQVSGYLPEGEWKHVWSKRVYRGGTRVRVDAPLGEPGLFIRMGSRNQKLLEKSFGMAKE
jgi:sulfoquinovosidase